MTYFDEDLTNTLKKIGVVYKQLSESDHKKLIHQIQQKVIFIGNQIDWSTLKNPCNLNSIEKTNALTQISEKLKTLATQNVIFLGDSAIDHAYSIEISDIKEAVDIFSEIPQHTYIFPENLRWIACLSLEGHIDYADFPED
ncbi:hypothetical protein GIR22_17865 [Pseudomonas sp. CCM 7891]|uniref:Uncharacterized protein n=1 Tax=Pseudomonas karstica TaxID=1055468 RepID=A0A7X2RW26_9PSED|nr:hypothetical protein [Pseudomonas karstica]MTD20992.1 hypothetical protein [Pseudomonas karstica]